MNDRQLRSFISAADYKSFSKAALDFNISTPALINQVNILEKNTGLELFIRGTHGIELTEHGKLFYKTAVRIIQMYEDVIEQCKRDENKFVINILDHLGIKKENLINFCINYQIEHPDIVIRFRDKKDSEDAIQLLDSDQIQLCTSIEPKDGTCGNNVFFPVLEDKYSLLVNKKHPVGQDEKPIVDNIKGREVVIRCIDNCKDNEVINRFEQNTGANLKVLLPNFESEDYVNDVVAGHIVMMPSIYCHISELGYEQIRVCRTDYPAGICGFIAKPNADKRIIDFIESYKKFRDAL